MKHEFSDILELYNAVKSGFDMNSVEGAFADREQWASSPDVTPIIFFDEDDIYDDEDVEYEEIENDDDDVPRVAMMLGLRYFLMGPILMDIFAVFDRQGREPSIQNLVRATNHYREFDSFQPN